MYIMRQATQPDKIFPPQSTQVPVSEMTSLAAQQPALLVITPNTIRAALNAFGEKMGQEPKACLTLLVEDPGEWGEFRV